MNQPAPIVTDAASNPPREFGAKMAALRAQFNLTAQEVSERLHIRPRYVTAIEEGRYDLMPGKVYARGYVHTYAEFLGMNADEVVAQCFAGELPANAQPVPAPAYTRSYVPTQGPKLSSSASQAWRGYAIMGVVALVVVLVIAQFNGRNAESEPTAAPAVAPVPEAMLASVRNLVMPTAQNYDCLTNDEMLTCFATDDTMRELGRLAHQLPYGLDIDVAALIVAPSDAAPAETGETKPEDAKPSDE